MDPQVRFWASPPSVVHATHPPPVVKGSVVGLEREPLPHGPGGQSAELETISPHPQDLMGLARQLGLFLLPFRNGNDLFLSHHCILLSG